MERGEKTGKKRVRQVLAALCLAGQLGLCLHLAGDMGPDGKFLKETAAPVVPVSQTQSVSAELKLYSQSAVLMDGSNGRILYGKNERLSRPMASTTKIMTCILALEAGNTDAWFEASKKAASQPQVRMGVKAGESYLLKDLLYALMLESYNDAAVMIAEGIAGSAEEFAVRMNEKAHQIGCRDTWFITPNGLDGREKDRAGKEKIHSTTAADLALILRYCVTQSPKREEFLAITGAGDHYFTDQSGKRSFSCRNHNALLTMMDGALTGKTGFTGGAGYCYTGALKKEERLYIIALLGCGWPPHKTYKWSDARTLFNYGIQEYELTDIFMREPDQTVRTENGICWGENKEGIVKAVMAEKEQDSRLVVLLSKEEQENVKRRVFLPDCLTAPVKKGDLIGRVEYTLGDEKLGEYGLFADRDILPLTLPAAWAHLLGDFFIF